MINQTTCFTYLWLKIDPVIIKTLNFKYENVSFTKLQRILTIKPKKYVGGSSAVPRVLLDIPGTCTGTRTLTKILESKLSNRQID